jgi:hypothetical protein
MIAPHIADMHILGFHPTPRPNGNILGSVDIAISPDINLHNVTVRLRKSGISIVKAPRTVIGNLHAAGGKCIRDFELRLPARTYREFTDIVVAGLRGAKS